MHFRIANKSHFFLVVVEVVGRIVVVGIVDAVEVVISVVEVISNLFFSCSSRSLLRIR